MKASRRSLQWLKASGSRRSILPTPVAYLDKDSANAMLAQDIERLARLQERLYACNRWALLVVLQGMDAAGKDGAIKHVMSGINPQNCEVYPFKPPTAEELDHHSLWRTAIRLPERRHIGIFNRSPL